MPCIWCATSSDKVAFVYFLRRNEQVIHGVILSCLRAYYLSPTQLMYCNIKEVLFELKKIPINVYFYTVNKL